MAGTTKMTDELSPDVLQEYGQFKELIRPQLPDGWHLDDFAMHLLSNPHIVGGLKAKADADLAASRAELRRDTEARNQAHAERVARLQRAHANLSRTITDESPARTILLLHRLETELKRLGARPRR
jgi:hypothetical protein